MKNVLRHGREKKTLVTFFGKLLFISPFQTVSAISVLKIRTPEFMASIGLLGNIFSIAILFCVLQMDQAVPGKRKSLNLILV